MHEFDNLIMFLTHICKTAQEITVKMFIEKFDPLHAKKNLKSNKGGCLYVFFFSKIVFLKIWQKCVNAVESCKKFPGNILHLPAVSN